MTIRQQGYAAAAGVTLLVVATHAPLLLGRASPIWDALEFFGPYQMLIGDYVHSGRLLLWNPFTSFGSPDAIEPQLGAFSPLVLLVGLVFGGSRHGFEIYWLVVWLLGPIGVLRLARHLGTPVWGAYAVAVGWAMSGFYTGHAEHTAWIASMSSLPWILWRLDAAIRDERIWPAVEAGALWGLSALAGYPGIIFLNACFAAAWTIGRTRPVHAVKALLTMGAVGVVVLSPTYGSFLIEGSGYSHRAGALPFDVAVGSNALHPLALITLTSPGLALADIYQYTDISMRSVYVGSVIPVLAAIALVAGRRPGRWLLLATGLVFLAAALGHSLPVRGWLYEWVLPTRYFRNAAMFRAYLMFSLLLLALHGAADIESVLALRDRRSRVAYGTGAAVAALALAAYLLAMRTIPRLGAGELVQVLQPIAGWALLFDLCLIAAVSNRVSRRLIPIALVIVATLDGGLTAYVMRPVMYGTGAAQWRELDARRVADPSLTARGLSRVADNGNNFTFAPKVPAASGYAPLTGPLVRDYVSEPVLLDAAVGPERLWFSAKTVETDRSSACLAALRTAAARLGAPPLVLHSRHAMGAAADDSSRNCRAGIAALAAAQRLRAGAVHVDTYTPERLRMRVRVEESGWLLVTDSWSRGWTAVVNGQPAEVLGANFLFRAVRVGPGTNTIDFRYRPYGYPWLLLVSWGTLLLVLIVTVRRRRSTPNHAEPESAGA